MRELAYVPMIHHESEAARKNAVELGGERAEVILDIINEKIYPVFWDEVRAYLEDQNFDKVYFESYREDSEDLLERNIGTGQEYGVALGLVCAGAELVPTEHMATYKLREVLLKTAHKLAREGLMIDYKKMHPSLLFALIAAEQDCFSEADLDLLNELAGEDMGIDLGTISDRYIARQVASTLGVNERGILFLGGKHKADDLIEDRGIKVTRFQSPLLDLLERLYDVI